MSNQQVSLQLERVICRDETGGSFTERFGNDEISLSAIGIDATGTVFKLGPFSVFANFDDKEEKIFNPPKTLFALAVPDAGAFPKNCKVLFLLAEVGGGGSGHEKATQEAFEKARQLIADKKADMSSNGEDPEDSPGLVDQIWEFVGERVINFVKAAIISGIKDDVFPPKDASVTITSPDFRFPDGSRQSPDESIEFTGFNGKYVVVYFWQIETVATGTSPVQSPPDSTDPCQAQVEATTAAQSVVNGINAEIEGLQTELQSASPGERPFLISEIARVKKDFPAANAALDAARRVLQSCLDQTP